METNFCDPTKPLSRAEDLAALGPPTSTLSGGELVPTGGPPLVGAMAVALFALALIVAGALLRVLGEAHGSGLDGEAPCGAGGSEGGGFEAG